MCRINDTRDGRNVLSAWEKYANAHRNQSLALKERVPNEALSCNLFLRHVSATVYDIAKCKTSAKVPCQI